LENNSSHPHNSKEAVALNNIDTIHQFEALFNFATIGIIVTNHKGKIINFNRCAESQFGYTKEEITGQPVEVLLPKKIHKVHVGYREEYYKNPEPRIMGHGRDLYAQTKDGNTFPVEVSLSHYIIHNETFVIAFVADITVRKKHISVVLEQRNELENITTEIKRMNSELEQKVEDRTKMLREALVELEKSKEELSEAFEAEKGLNEMKSRFVTMASHEFRTPLSTILSSAYLLQKYSEPTGDEKVAKHVRRIKGAVSGMKNILEDFLNLGKLEERLVPTNMEHIAADTFVDLIQNLIGEFEGLLKRGQEVQLMNTIRGEIWIDKNLLKNILMNLISNAIKFTSENSIISISSSIVLNELVITVTDNGIGISEEDQQRLFERFFRGKNAGNIQGTGLGLHIVGKYLELMNGRIELASKIDEGSKFTIFIPQRITSTDYEKDTDNRR
jgi:PAS domain S-box-containing protein